ncbi:MFS transporter [Saccharopolyspora sp. NFXS83]|uniref:MFS transporter n=1 Tax=Saccharopolyspora sp. NFXS83 TaxID=2993560 RepID=UPI00224A7188|nr:MFS transporter [Saccharopolyspora sp. NFXS83]MCX2731427.1 MFS transporter [Saccharopolyspora sp. NFXS83]
MALTGFVIIMTETLPAGLLPEVSSGLAVSEGAAGQLVSAYALGTVLAAIPAIAATRSSSRKPLLVLGIAGFVVANAVTALSGVYSLTLVARFVAGAFSGLLWGMIPGYTRRIVAAERAGTGLAVAMAGTPVALSIGTPLGTFAGALIGWRWTFAAMSVLAVALVVWVLIGVPNAPGQPSGNRTSLLRVLLIPGVAPVLAVVLGWMLAHNILYTYIAPFLTFTGVSGRVDVVLLLFGLCALAGIWFTGTLVDRALRRLVLVSLTGFGLVALGLGVAGGAPVVFYLAVLVWGLTFGGASTQLNTAVADAAGDETDIAAAMVTTAWNLAIFGGSALGAVLLEADDPGSFPWALLVLITASLLVAILARRHAFAPGPRSGDSAT